MGNDIYLTEERVVYFEQILAGMFLFRGSQVSCEDVFDLAGDFCETHGYEIAYLGDIEKLADFVDSSWYGYTLKSGVSLDSSINKGYTVEAHLIINAGAEVYNYMHDKFAGMEPEASGEQPFTKALSRIGAKRAI